MKTRVGERYLLQGEETEEEGARGQTGSSPVVNSCIRPKHGGGRYGGGTVRPKLMPVSAQLTFPR